MYGGFLRDPNPDPDSHGFAIGLIGSLIALLALVYIDAIFVAVPLCLLAVWRGKLTHSKLKEMGSERTTVAVANLIVGGLGLVISLVAVLLYLG